MTRNHFRRAATATVVGRLDDGRVAALPELDPISPTTPPSSTCAPSSPRRGAKNRPSGADEVRRGTSRRHRRASSAAAPPANRPRTSRGSSASSHIVAARTPPCPLPRARPARAMPRERAVSSTSPPSSAGRVASGGFLAHRARETSSRRRAALTRSRSALDAGSDGARPRHVGAWKGGRPTGAVGTILAERPSPSTAVRAPASDIKERAAELPVDVTVPLELGYPKS